MLLPGHIEIHIIGPAWRRVSFRNMSAFLHFARNNAQSSRTGKSALSSAHSEMMFRIVAVQFLATLVLSASCLFVGWVLAGSFLAGGIAAAVPNGFVAWRFTAAGARLDARTLIVAEGCRWVLSIGILAPALVLVSLDIVALLGAFALMQLVPIVVPLLRQRRREPEGLAMLDKKGA